MSISDVMLILDRISVATPASPIAVFRLPGGGVLGGRCLEAVFGATIGTRQRALRDPLFVGMFDRTMKEQEVAAILRAEAQRTSPPKVA